MDRPALNDVSLSIDPGSVVVLVGANGSGKTTAMEMLAGLRSPQSGQARFGGRLVKPGGSHRYHVGVQLQEAGLPQRLKVREAIGSAASLYADPGDVDGIVSTLGLDEHLGQMVDKLSGGWQRRLDIALACIGNPQLLILDEPTSGLDPTVRVELWEFLRSLRAQGLAVLASTHDLAEAEAYADRLLVLDRGRLLMDGPVSEVLASAGGTWRLRLTAVDQETIRFISEAGHRALSVGGNVSVIGEKESLAALATLLDEARGADRLRFQESLSGPVRLEDVFAHAAQQEVTK